MKQVKKWVYVLIMYVCIVAIDLIKIAITVSNGSRTLSFGWGAEIGVSLLKSLLDLVFVILIGFGVDYILRKITEKTLIPNIIITIVIFEILNLLLR